jgi:hypothetical protein
MDISKKVSVTKPIVEETIECKVNNMFNNLEGKGTCILSSQHNTYITVYTHINETFDDKYTSLEKCFSSPLNSTISKPVDLRKTNTLWIEFLTNESDKKGFGKKLFKSIIDKAKTYGYKYIFLYPSANLTNNKVSSVNQDTLISIYRTYGLKKLNLCKFYVYGTEFDKNIFDNNADYHLMFGAIDDLTLGDNYSEIQVNFREKYLKYKTKYLNLKKQL